MKTDSPDPYNRALGDLPGEFLKEARQKLLEDRSSGLVPIRAGSGVGLYEACSAVALSMGIRMPRRTAPVEDENLMAALDATLRPSGLRHRTIVLQADWFRHDSGPFLAFLADGGRPVALVPRKSRVYRLVDPVECSSRDIDEAAARLLKPEAVMFYRPFPDGPLNARQLLAFALQGRAWDLWLILIVGILAGILGLAVPLATEFVINQVIPGAQRGQLLEIGLGLVMVAAAMTLFHVTAAFAMLRIEGRGVHDVQTAVWSRVLQLNTGFFRNYSAGDLANRVDGINAIRHALSTAVIGYMLGAVFSLLNIGLIFYYSWKLAITAIVLTGIAGLVELVASWLELRYHRPSATLSGRITGRVFQLLNGIVKWKTAAAEERAIGQWAPLFLEKKRLDKAAGTIKAAAGAFRAFFPLFAILVNFAIFYFFLGGTLNAGAFMGYNAAFGQMLSAVLGAASATITLVNCIPLYERLRPILTAPVERDVVGADPGRLRGRLDVVDLRFRYAPDQPAVLDGVSFTAEPGEFVAIVGATGCGKSTLVRLLLGFESPESGAIFYDGRDFRNLDLQRVRRQFGVVLQHDRVRTGDILHNITGAGAYSLEEAWLAASRAGIKEEIERLPMGMHTFVPEGGGSFSGGQLQRLVIARALIKNPSILIFDEATSALDNTSQKIVSDNLRALKVTRIVIAQRLSSIRQADKIIVLDKGKVAESGSFDELLAKDGVFRRLAGRQMV